MNHVTIDSLWTTLVVLLVSLTTNVHTHMYVHLNVYYLHMYMFPLMHLPIIACVYVYVWKQ